MKKIYLAYLAFGISLLVSCNKDDDPKVDPVVGVWDLENLTLEVKNNEAAADTINGTYSPFQLFFITRLILDIKQDKTFEQEAVQVDGSKSSADGEWEKGENTLTLNFDDGDVSEYSIVSNDEGELKLSFDDVLELPDPNFPDDETKSVEVEATFTFNYEK
ncbi:MAG TPA: hypothetical protein VD908_19885 [Cytophagales bacterium]|nr:hypothetical protein [Cytophagales bacterium]